jgi:hypothetical protein
MIPSTVATFPLRLFIGKNQEKNHHSDESGSQTWWGLPGTNANLISKNLNCSKGN